MKRIISLLMAVTMMLSVIPFSLVANAAAKASTATLSVENVSAAVDSYVDVAINITENPGIVSMGLSIVFDEDLTLVGATNGEAFSELNMTPPAQLKKQGSVTGSCRFAWLGSDDCTELGTILVLTFKVSADAEMYKDCQISVSYDSGDILDNSRNPIELIATPGKVTIINYIPGDVDGNGTINMLDVLTLCQYYVDGCKYDSEGYGININPESGDVDANGKINMLDILTICQYYVDGCKYDPNGYGVKPLPGKRTCQHNMQHFAAKPVTCENDGNREYWYCDLCKDYFADANGKDIISYDYAVIKTAGHNNISYEAIPATPASEGYTEGVWCDKCNTWLSGHEKINPLKPNTRSIKYNIVNEAKHPYLLTVPIDQSALENSYVPGEKKALKNLDLGKYGYTFDGWYDGFGDGATQIKEIPETANEDIELYAHITEMVYDITYNMYQTPVSSTPSENQQHYTVSKGNSNLYNPEINNYKFLGWYDDNGVEYKTIPVGTTGNITLNAYYTSLRNLAISKDDNNPIIIEDQNTNVVYFTYEIGEIRNIPLNGDNPFWEIQSVAGLSQQVSKTYTTSITNSEAASVSKTISDITTNSSTWTLAESWNDVTTVNESWAQSIGKTTEQCKTEATTSSNTLSISAQTGGSSYHKTEDGATVYDYDSKTTTKDKGHEFGASLSGNYTNKVEANLGASTEYGATSSYGYTANSKNNEYNHTTSGSDKDVLSSGIKYENGFEVNAGVNYGYHNNTNTVTKTGTDKVTTNSKIDENTSNWNISSGFSSTQQHSSSQSIRNALSDIVTTTKGYGSSYSKGGTDSKTQGFSSTSSDTTGTTSSVTYSKLESETKTTTYNVDGKIEGKYRSILVGKAHVFAVVGYDYATKTFFTYTFSVMDDKVEEFLDYTPKGGNFDDCEYSCLPFEIPYYVFEYINEKTSKTSGIQYITDSLNGTAKITGYVGDSTDVIVPSYVSDGKQAYKVTEISGKAFAGKNIRSIVLGEFIKTIPDSAFKNCIALEEVIGSFTEIGNEAFNGCTNLTNMNIPSNVVKIGIDAFKGAYSINVRAINSLASYTEAVKLLPNGTEEEIRAKQKEITQKFVSSVLESGAKNIIIDLSYIFNNTPLSLTVPEVESIEINGGGKKYEDFNVDSSATNTTLNEMTIISKNSTPLKIDSKKLTLHKVFLSGTSTTLILKKDGAVLSLVQDSAINTSSEYAIIGKNIVIESQVTSAGAAGFLNVTKSIGYVNSINGEDYANIIDGKLIKITEEEFEKYLIGQITLTFDANGGSVSEQDKLVYIGETVGDLPTPIRSNLTFLGWFTDDGTQVTKDTVFTATSSVTVKAHWQSDWILASDLSSDGNVNNTKWTYDLTTKTTSNSPTAPSGYTAYQEPTWIWGSYSSWSSWSRTEVTSSDSRRIETKTVTDQAGYTQYRYWRYTNNNGRIHWCKTLGYQYHGGTWSKEYTSWSNSSKPIYKSNYGRCPCCGTVNLYGTNNNNGYYWEETRWIEPVTHTEYRYADRSKVYTYYYQKIEKKESTTEVFGSDTISNINKWVKYTID